MKSVKSVLDRKVICMECCFCVAGVTCFELFIAA
jgi:hypothetical protein